MLKKLLEEAISKEASDIHISVGHPPILRVDGSLTYLFDWDRLSSETARKMTLDLMSEAQRERFLDDKEIDFSYDLEGKARFRANAYFQSGEVSCSLRFVPDKIKSIEELNLPIILDNFSKAKQGFVLVTGPSSHGKSTTLAAIIERINETRFDHIITIEDPIEYIFKDKKALIDQREMYVDTASFSKALRSSFRQDPDVIMVGEMRDPQTIATAITAAETGHLVFSTLHTNSASQTVHRIIDSFSSEQQKQVKAQLSGCLLGIISQRLIPRKGGGLIPACEIMLNNPAVGNLIRDDKIHELDLVIETSREKGMISLNSSLAELVKKDEVSLENALSYSLDPHGLKRMCQ